MTALVGLSVYVDVPAYLRAATNQETASLIGLNTTLTDAALAGTATLAVAGSAGWAAGPAWILDGPWSELAQLVDAPDGAHVTLSAPGTRFDHGAGASLSQSGPAGALAEVILRASGWIENYCRQGAMAGDRSLFAVSRSERWGMPTGRAWLDRDGVLALRPGHFPVQAVDALGVEFGPGRGVSFDVSQIELAGDRRLIEVPYRAAGSLTPGQQLLLGMRTLSRDIRQWVTLTYTGGLMPGSVPGEVEQACIWVVSDLLAVRRNPAGAAVVRQGKFELSARLRGDPTGDSILLMRAKEALAPYRVESM